MNLDFWEARWRAQQIGFHQAQATPALVRHLTRMGPAPATVLVPLAGKSLDLRYLAEQGHRVVAVEGVESAVQSFFDEQAIAATRSDGRHPVLEGGGIRVVIADFFQVHPQELGPVDWAFDRAALVAVAPADQARYAAQLRRLLAASADPRMLLVSFSYVQSEMNGPPFAATEAQVRALYAGARSMELLERMDGMEDRFRARGLTAATEDVWEIHL